jgi:hypothetical protein
VAVDESPADGRVLIASSGGPLTAEPSWTRYDNLSACRCSGFDWQRGRQSEFDQTNTGTARVYFHDRDGTFSSDTFIGRQIMLQLWDPCAEAWEPVFRGHIDDIHNTPSPGAPTLTNLQVDAVDILDYLGGVKVVPGEFGDTPPPKMAGIVFYEDGPVDDRLNDLATDAGIAASMKVIFTGNVDVLEAVLDVDDDVLSAMRTASDAEFPSGVANVYADRYGRLVFHGRFARFDPETTASEGGNWDFTRWDAATREDVTAGVAQIREFQFNRPRTRIINSYVAWPELTELHKPFPQKLIATNQTFTDPTSIAAYGYRGREASALQIKEHKTNGNTGAEECALFAEYYVANYAVPRMNIERIAFKSLHPDDPRAADVWALMSRIDISDAMQLFVDEAGLTDEEFFVEGISGECRVGPPEYDFVTVTPNLSPGAYFNTFDMFEEGT